MLVYLIEHRIGDIATLRAVFRERPTERDRIKVVGDFESRSIGLPEIVSQVRLGLLTNPIIELEIIENGEQS